MVGDRFDFFISHAGADRAWAEWVAWQLTEAGYTVELGVWDWAAGQNVVTAMSDALERCDRVVALFSAAYFDRSRYTTEEWTTAMLHVPGGDQRLVPVRVEEVPVTGVPAVLRTLVFRDIFDMDAAQARRVLLEAVAGPRRPDRAPVFPGRGRPGQLAGLGGSGPRLPGSVPQVWGSIPARNPGFTGRDGLLVAVRERLLSGSQAVVQALQGMGGVGKTQLAIEYAHRFAGAYDLVWWVDAEQAGHIGEQVAALGAELGCVETGAGVSVVRSAVLGELRRRDRWLLVFDNAEDPGEVIGWLPGGGGHVLITSRERGWAEIAVPVEIDVLARAESVAILQARVSGLAEADADQLARRLGDLPLAITQAASYLAATGMAADRYMELLATRAGQILAQATPVTYPRSLAAATQLTADKLARDDPPAAELANVCAFLAPEPIPEQMFTRAARDLPAELADRVADPLAWSQTLAHLTRQALARIDQRGLQMHRLTQAILRDRLPPGQAAATRACAEAILAANHPGSARDAATWPEWAGLMPHLLASDLAATDNPGLRNLAAIACLYLVARGDASAGRDLGDRLCSSWRERLGADDRNTLRMATNLAWALWNLGEYAAARDLDQDTLDRCRRLLGEDHSETLNSATNLANDLVRLGELQAARDLHQDTLDRRRRVLGEDHPDTLTSASNLASDLRALGELQAARDLHQDTLDRCRRVLGEDHPSTLNSAYNLANALVQVGELQAAFDLHQDTLDRRGRVLGEDHPSTLNSANNLANALYQLGELQAARDLYQDILDRRRRVLGEDHPDTLTSASNLALALRALRETGDGP
jgi:tetratricopeptide (TPR) repeat protein